MTEDGETGFSATCGRQPARKTGRKVAVERKKFHPEPEIREIFSSRVGKSGNTRY
jgi:hypothetical protein